MPNARKFCTQCGHSNRRTAKVCVQCGAAFTRRLLAETSKFCPECGIENKISTKFCPHCGYALVPKPPEKLIAPPLIPNPAPAVALPPIAELPPPPNPATPPVSNPTNTTSEPAVPLTQAEIHLLRQSKKLVLKSARHRRKS